MTDAQENGRIRRARIATMIAFAVNGAMPATLLARYAEVMETLDLTTAMFGILVAAITIGAATTMHVPGILLRKFGSRSVAVVGTVGLTFGFILAALALMSGNVWLFALALFVAGYFDSTVDVAQNAQGLQVQVVMGRSVLTAMHAGWSVGAAIGGGIGTLAASLGIPLVTHLAIWGAVCVMTMAIAGTQFLPVVRSEESEAAGRVPWSAWKLLAPLVLVAMAGIAVEDIGNNWSAVLLSTERGVPTAQAGIGITTLLGAQFVGRMLGDRVIDSFGRRPTLLVSLAGIFIGLNIVAWTPEQWFTIIGFALAGFACAVTVPLAYAEADTLPGLRAHTGVTLLAWIMRVATVGLTPLIGGISTVSTLPIAISLFSLIAVAALCALFVTATRND